jgi:hypothetical protein
MASYRSMLSATRTYVDEYVTRTLFKKKRIKIYGRQNERSFSADNWTLYCFGLCNEFIDRVLTCEKRMTLQAMLPACQATVIFHTISVKTLITPTLKSLKECTTFLVFSNVVLSILN